MYSVDTDARNDQDVERNITVAELKMFEDVASCIHVLENGQSGLFLDIPSACQA